MPFKVDRAINRWWDYPRHVDRHRRRYDLFHVVDHSYAQLVHRLPAERTVVTCHDLDTFRSILRPEEEPRSLLFRTATRRILSGLRSAARMTCDTATVRNELLALRPRGTAARDRRVAGRERGLLVGGRRLRTMTRRRVSSRRLQEPSKSSMSGATIPRKRIDTLLAVCTALLPRVPDLHLIRVGGAFTASSSACSRSRPRGPRLGAGICQRANARGRLSAGRPRDVPVRAGRIRLAAARGDAPVGRRSSPAISRC